MCANFDKHRNAKGEDKGSQSQILSARPMSADRPTLILSSQPPFQGILPLVSETLDSDVIVELNLAPSESLWCGPGRLAAVVCDRRSPLTRGLGMGSV